MKADTYIMHYHRNINEEWERAKRSGKLRGVTAIYSPMRFNKAIIGEIGVKYPRITTLYMAASLIRQLGPIPLKVAEEYGISIEVSRPTAGRPRIHDAHAIYMVMHYHRIGIPSEEISRRTGIPLRTVYYILKHR